jgi:hypothetical protein
LNHTTLRHCFIRNPPGTEGYSTNGVVILLTFAENFEEYLAAQSSQDCRTSHDCGGAALTIGGCLIEVYPFERRTVFRSM